MYSIVLDSITIVLPNSQFRIILFYLLLDLSVVLVDPPLLLRQFSFYCVAPANNQSVGGASAYKEVSAPANKLWAELLCLNDHIRRCRLSLTSYRAKKLKKPLESKCLDKA